MINISTKDELLNKLRNYTITPDDNNIRYKEKIRSILLNNAELLYALNNKDLESELFDDNGNLIIDENYNLIGEVEKYFGDDSNIRPYLFLPNNQTEVKHYICYQVMFDEFPKNSNIQKYTEITFSIFVDRRDITDKLTGIPRHDLIASIIRETFNWSNIFGIQTHLISSKESTTDNNYIVRTLVFQITDLNGITYTPGGRTNGMVINKLGR